MWRNNEATIESIRNNDSNIKAIAVPLFDPLCNTVGQALQGNQHVSHICLEIEWYGHSDLVDQPVDALTRYICGENLRKLHFRVDDTSNWDVNNRQVASRAIGSILQSVTRSNISNIDSVDLSGSVNLISTADACSFLKAKKSTLKNLSVELAILHTSAGDDSSMRQFAKDIATVEAWTRLEVVIGENDVQEFQQILQELHHHPSLGGLSVSAHFVNSDFLVVTAVSTLISPNQHIRLLEWHGVDFTEETMTLLVECLTNHPSLRKLELENTLSREAAAVFSRFLLLPSSVSSIQELSFGYTSEDVADHSVVSMISTLRCDNDASMEYRGSVASSIQKLRLKYCLFDRHRETFEILTKSKIAELVVDDLAGWTLMLDSLEHFRYLRTLSIDSQWNWNGADFVTALHANGSLIQVSVLPDRTTPFFSEQETRRVHAICERNRLVPQLVQRPQLNNAAGVTTITDNGDSSAPTPTTTALAMFPPLFQVIMPAVQTTSNTVLSGLLALSGNSIRQGQTGAKRSSS